MRSKQIELGDNGSEFKQQITEEVRKLLELPPCDISRACMSASDENPLKCIFYKRCKPVRKFLLL